MLLATPARAVLAWACAAALTGLAAPAAQAQDAPCTAPATRLVQPGTGLKAALTGLCPGDTLALAPGTYPVGDMRLYNDGRAWAGSLHPGTDGSPITVTAADPARPPLITGSVQLTGAHYWRLSHLRIRATVHDRPALMIRGGTGWQVTDSELWGARDTTCRANLAIMSGDTAEDRPSRFLLARNTIHDAGRSGRAEHTDHNIYVAFAGGPGSGGLITRNVIYGHPNGAGIKIGDGGAARAPGPWGLTVSYNTIYNGGRQILLHGDVRSNSIHSNLLVRSTQGFRADPRTTAIYIHDVVGRGNRIWDNYAFGASMLGYDPHRSITWGRGNRLGRGRPADPRLTSAPGRPLRPANAAVRLWGRYSPRS